jgi:hypothetical protein
MSALTLQVAISSLKLVGWRRKRGGMMNARRRRLDKSKDLITANISTVSQPKTN